MKQKPMKRIYNPQLTPEQKAELKTLGELPDDQINTQNIPEQTDWTNARRRLLFRPIKKQLTLRIDADLINWFQTRAPNGKGYQTSINDALREYVIQHAKNPHRVKST